MTRASSLRTVASAVMVGAICTACLSVARAFPVPQTSPVSAYTPCAERLVVRNTSREDRSLLLAPSAGRSRTVIARAHKGSADAGHTATIITLTRGGVSGVLSGGGANVPFDSRSFPPCIRPLPDTVPGPPDADYTMRNSSTPRTEEWSIVPGIIMVVWKRPIQRQVIDKLIVETGASLIGATPRPGGHDLYYFWFDADDSTGRVARARAETFQRSPAVDVATPLSVGSMLESRRPR